jgi:hypothetical protein
MNYFYDPNETEETTIVRKKPTLRERRRGRKIKKFVDKYRNRPDIADAIVAEYHNNPNADFDFRTPQYDKNRKYWIDA